MNKSNNKAMMTPEEEAAVRLAQMSQNNIIRETLLALKREIHDKAVHPYHRDIDPYINLKVFDAVIQGYINKYDNHRR